MLLLPKGRLQFQISPLQQQKCKSWIVILFSSSQNNRRFLFTALSEVSTDNISACEGENVEECVVVDIDFDMIK